MVLFNVSRTDCGRLSHQIIRTRTSTFSSLKSNCSVIVVLEYCPSAQAVRALWGDRADLISIVYYCAFYTVFCRHWIKSSLPSPICHCSRFDWADCWYSKFSYSACSQRYRRNAFKLRKSSKFIASVSTPQVTIYLACLNCKTLSVGKITFIAVSYIHTPSIRPHTCLCGCPHIYMENKRWNQNLIRLIQVFQPP